MNLELLLLSEKYNASISDIRKCIDETAKNMDLSPDVVSYNLINYILPPKITTEIKIKSPSKKQLNILSSYFEKDLEKYHNFRGNYMFEWGWLLWLQEKLSGVVCAWAAEDNKGVLYDKKKGLKVSNYFLKSLTDCSKTARFIVGISTLQLGGGKFHANALIFDTKTHTLTRFEPHGSDSLAYSVQDFDKQIEKWLSKNNYVLGSKKLSNWKYRKPSDYCPIAGPQTRESWKLITKDINKESGGFCSAWSLLYIHFRISNPDFSDKEISEYMNNLTDKELSFKIREYAEFITRNINKNWIVDKNKKYIELGAYVKIYGEIGIIVDIKGDNVEVWSVIRNPGSKIKFGPTLGRISDIHIIEDPERKKQIDNLLKIQFENPISSTKNFTSRVQNYKNNKLLMSKLNI